MQIRKRLKNINFDKKRLAFGPGITQQTLINIATVIIGSFIFAIGVNSFMIAGNLGEGGVTGLAIILYYAFDISPAVSNFVLNGILLVVGFKFLSRRAMYYTIVVVFLTSFFLWLTETWRIETDEILINTVFGGALVGLGIGLIIRIGATTAGTTILARLVNKYMDVNVSYALMFFDLVVITIGLTVMTLEQVLLTVIALYIAMKVMDFIIEGMNPKKAITIISDHPDRLGKMINSEIRRGVTIMNGRGFYTQEDKDILYVIINKSQLTRLKRLIRRYDEKAFVVVHDVNSVLGNYFI
ncbi:YitT family protein [Salinicoccus sp. ID82-1]|uniref:YitT family protein n=1 Tax=Salinicoccus sp. ID82-1 TaxID=2820269 RepID=UPI001F1B4539|nr:YitT family protein [Salinicoccus sp. ID82-1]